MSDITMLAIDLAKNVFQLHGVAADGRVIVRRQVRRARLLSSIARLAPVRAFDKTGRQRNLIRRAGKRG